MDLASGGELTRVENSGSGSGGKSTEEAARGSSINSDGFAMPSLETVFGGQHITTPVPPRPPLFPTTYDAGKVPPSVRAAAVRKEDIPCILQRMSEMQVFAITAHNVGASTGPSFSETASLQLREPDHSAVVIDVDALRAAFRAVKNAFPPHWNHFLAIKSCPLPIVIQEALHAGLGLEAASFVELYMALSHGCPADLVAFDSPAKTNQELELALARGTLINANSLVELQRIDSIIKRQGCSSDARVGIRLNPLVGAGSIAELGVSVLTSKFAVPATPWNVQAVVDAFRKWPWLVALHTHVGSQGYSLDQLAEGISALCRIADVIDGALGKGRVRLLDIGGGLPANYESDEVSPSFSEYAAVLKKNAPSLFENTERVVISEFGRSLVAKAAIIVSTVEYVRGNMSDRSATTQEECNSQSTQTQADVAIVDSGSASDAPESCLPLIDHQTLVTHVGADLFLRTSYCPGKYSHRLSIFTREGFPVGGPLIKTDVAGPLCFQGDYVSRGASLPRTNPGDLVVVHDTGANTLSLFSRHCSRRSPSVYGCMRDTHGGMTVRLLKEKESVEDVARFWGAW